MKKFIGFVCLVLVLVSVFAVSAFAFDYPTFPGFPQGMAYVTDLDIGQQWIHNTPYGGLTCFCYVSGQLADNRLLQITNVSYSKYYATYEFDIIGYACDSLEIWFPFYVDPVLFDNGYTFQYEIQCDLPMWTSGVSTYNPVGPSLDTSVRWYTFGLQDLTSPAGFYLSPLGGNSFDYLFIKAKGISDNTTFHGSISVIYIESVLDRPPLPTGSVDFWHLGRSTDFGQLSTAVNSIFSSNYIATVYENVFTIFNSSPLLLSLLTLVVSLQMLSILFDLVLHG